MQYHCCHSQYHESYWTWNPMAYDEGVYLLLRPSNYMYAASKKIYLMLKCNRLMLIKHFSLVGYFILPLTKFCATMHHSHTYSGLVLWSTHRIHNLWTPIWFPCQPVTRLLHPSFHSMASACIRPTLGKPDVILNASVHPYVRHNVTATCLSTKLIIW